MTSSDRNLCLFEHVTLNDMNMKRSYLCWSTCKCKLVINIFVFVSVEICWIYILKIIVDDSMIVCATDWNGWM